MNDWGKLVEAIKAIPEERRIFSTEYYDEPTSDTKLPCGCAAGQILFNLGLHGMDELEHRLNVPSGVIKKLFEINDSFKRRDNTEAACRERYTHVLAECERRSQFR